MNRSLSNNGKLNKASKIKNDEFYTRYDDIEKELHHYQPYFDNKIVFCNCDDFNISQFYSYFKTNFLKLNLKKLFCLCYNQNGSTYQKEVYYNDGHLIETESLIVSDGSFASDESIAILKQSDIVVTNPPFSLFHSFINTLLLHEKKFIIIGNCNAITNTKIFSLIRENKISLGLNCIRRFDTPTKKNIEAARSYWYTNLPISNLKSKIELSSIKPSNLIEYDNYHAINVNKTNQIPKDHYGTMGVPITFLEKHHPEQFELLCIDNEIKNKHSYLIKDHWLEKTDRGYVNGKRMYSRIFIRAIY